MPDAPRLPRARRLASQKADEARVGARRIGSVSGERLKRAAARLEAEEREQQGRQMSDTERVMRRAEDAATAGAPVEASLEPLDGPGHLEMMARGGGGMGPPGPDSPASPPPGQRGVPPSDSDHVGGLTMESLIVGGRSAGDPRRGGRDYIDRQRSRSQEARASDEAKQAEDVVYDPMEWDPDENDLYGVDDGNPSSIPGQDGDPMLFESSFFGGGEE